MWIIHIISALFLCKIESVSSNTWLDPFVQKLRTELKPHQVTSFENNRIQYNQQMNQFVKAIANTIPIVRINLQRLSDHQLRTMPVHENPRASRTLYIILQDRENVEVVKETIDAFVKLAPIPTRPKCMLVYFNDDPSVPKYYREIVEYAWSLQFLEFLIVQIKGDGHPKRIDYNPFDGHITEEQLGDDDKSLYPDKLLSIKQYTLKLQYSRNTKNEKFDLDELDLPVSIFLKRLNSTMQGVSDGADNPLDMLSRGEIAIGYPVTFDDWIYHGRTFLLAKVHQAETSKFVVPSFTYNKVNLQSISLVNLICFLVIIVCFKLSTKVLRIAGRGGWRLDDILQLLLGMGISSERWSRLPDKIIGMAMILLSITVSADLIESLLDIRILQQEVAFDSIDDIRNSELSIGARKPFCDSLAHSPTEIGTLAKQCKPLDFEFECFDANERGELHFCVAHQEITKFLLEEYQHLHMRQLNFIEFQNFRAYPFEKASPYVEKFNDVITKIVEADIRDLELEYYFQLLFSQEDTKDETINEPGILVGLLFILVVGVTLGIVTFLTEVFMYQVISWILKLREMCARFAGGCRRYITSST